MYVVHRYLYGGERKMGSRRVSFPHWLVSVTKQHVLATPHQSATPAGRWRVSIASSIFTDRGMKVMEWRSPYQSEAPMSSAVTRDACTQYFSLMIFSRSLVTLSHVKVKGFANTNRTKIYSKTPLPSNTLIFPRHSTPSLQHDTVHLARQ